MLTVELIKSQEFYYKKRSLMKLKKERPIVEDELIITSVNWSEDQSD